MLSLSFDFEERWFARDSGGSSSVEWAVHFKDLAVAVVELEVKWFQKNWTTVILEGLTAVAATTGYLIKIDFKASSKSEGKQGVRIATAAVSSSAWID